MDNHNNVLGYRWSVLNSPDARGVYHNDRFSPDARGVYHNDRFFCSTLRRRNRLSVQIECSFPAGQQPCVRP